MTDKTKQVTLDYSEHERLINEIDSLKSHIHQCETDGKYKVTTVTRYLTTRYIAQFGPSELHFDGDVSKLMSIDELDALKLSATDGIVRDVANREKELNDQGDKLKLKEEVITVLMKSKELLDEVRELGFFARIKFLFVGVK